MILDIFLILYAIFLCGVAAWAAYSSYLVIRCGVPPVPTSKKICQAMIKAAKLRTGERAYDLGCGFGSVLFAAQKLVPENTYVGYDLNRPVLWWAQLRNRLGRHQIDFQARDFFGQDLHKADVIFCYLWPSIMQRIEHEIWPQLKPGARLISHGFPLGSIQPAATIVVGRAKLLVYQK